MSLRCEKFISGRRREIQRAVARYEVADPVLDETVSGEVDGDGVAPLDLSLQFFQRDQHAETRRLIFKQRKDMVGGYAAAAGALEEAAEPVRVGGGKLERFGVRVVGHTDHDCPESIAVDPRCVLGQKGRRSHDHGENDDPWDSMAHANTCEHIIE